MYNEEVYFTIFTGYIFYISLSLILYHLIVGEWSYALAKPLKYYPSNRNQPRTEESFEGKIFEAKLDKGRCRCVCIKLS